ncbi:MAG TPA: hypothetical protein VK695_03840 [Steroidobacteraceae bacterium]|nr:hypothetical protein [Steroidobacteraceae bacterium]
MSAASPGYQLTLRQTPRFLHAVVTGANSRENVAGYFEQLLNECRGRGCRRVLLEERLEGPRLSASEAFTLAAQGALRFSGLVEAMAYVDVYAEGDTMHFAERVAVQRAFPVRVFGSVAAAERWLTTDARTD